VPTAHRSGGLHDRNKPFISAQFCDKITITPYRRSFRKTMSILNTISILHYVLILYTKRRLRAN